MSRSNLMIPTVFCLLVLALPLYAQEPQEPPQQPQQPPEQMQPMPPVISADFQAAMRLYRQRRYAEAVEAFTKIAEAEPNSAAAFYFMGYAHYEMDHHSEAITAFRKAFQADPKFDPRPYFRSR